MKEKHTLVLDSSTPSGIRFHLEHSREQDKLFEYKDFSEFEQNFAYGHQNLPFIKSKPAMPDRDGITFEHILDNRLVQALNKFVLDANAGHPYECRAALPPAQAAAEAIRELADFQQKAAARRAMNPKPQISDEVIKKRLLAEGAVQQKNFSAAADYYRAGVTIDPSWAPGWYNAALISAGLKDYAAAALEMKHYLILLPEASDAAAAKEQALLWQAKAEQTSRK
jgi:hypothetical protein